MSNGDRSHPLRQSNQHSNENDLAVCVGMSGLMRFCLAKKRKNCNNIFMDVEWLNLSSAIMAFVMWKRGRRNYCFFLLWKSLTCCCCWKSSTSYWTNWVYHFFEFCSHNVVFRTILYCTYLLLAFLLYFVSVFFFFLLCYVVCRVWKWLRFFFLVV